VTTPRVTVVDYGIGNLHSVTKALRHEGAEVTVTADARDVPVAERLVLPGVGAFADGMRGLRERGLVEPLRAYAEAGRPLLGICLGMQLLLGESEEYGRHEGLGIVPGRVAEIRREKGFKVPQIGWNRIYAPSGGSWQGTLLDRVDEGAMVYFVHSFTAVPDREEDRLADSLYAGQRVSAAVRRGSVSGCQFHPEKSGTVGLTILRRFLAAA
jgi:imidazole glycerol-phosphate synthase subunit HisH